MNRELVVHIVTELTLTDLRLAVIQIPELDVSVAGRHEGAAIF